jgi:hypothetical protein
MAPLHGDGEEYIPGQYNKEGGILEVTIFLDHVYLPT